MPLHTLGQVTCKLLGFHLSLCPSLHRSTRVTDLRYHIQLYTGPGDLNSGTRAYTAGEHVTYRDISQAHYHSFCHSSQAELSLTLLRHILLHSDDDVTSSQSPSGRHCLHALTPSFLFSLSFCVALLLLDVTLHAVCVVCTFSFFMTRYALLNAETWFTYSLLCLRCLKPSAAYK